MSKELHKKNVIKFQHSSAYNFNQTSTENKDIKPKIYVTVKDKTQVAVITVQVFRNTAVSMWYVLDFMFNTFSSYLTVT